MYKRLLFSILFGALLGVICVAGAQSRFADTLSMNYIIAMWFNRVLMGLVIGLITVKTTLIKRLIRGLIIGWVISFSFYVSTEFLDLAGFLVGGLYGVLIELGLYLFALKTGDL